GVDLDRARRRRALLAADLRRPERHHRRPVRAAQVDDVDLPDDLHLARRRPRARGRTVGGAVLAAARRDRLRETCRKGPARRYHNPPGAQPALPLPAGALLFGLPCGSTCLSPRAPLPVVGVALPSTACLLALRTSCHSLRRAAGRAPRRALTSASTALHVLPWASTAANAPFSASP